MRYQVVLEVEIDATGHVMWTAWAMRPNGTPEGYIVAATDPAYDKALAKLIAALKAAP